MSAFQAVVGGGGGLEPCVQLLQRAAADKSVKPEVVEGALAYLEQNHGEGGSAQARLWLSGGADTLTRTTPAPTRPPRHHGKHSPAGVVGQRHVAPGVQHSDQQPRVSVHPSD